MKVKASALVFIILALILVACSAAAPREAVQSDQAISQESGVMEAPAAAPMELAAAEEKALPPMATAAPAADMFQSNSGTGGLTNLIQGEPGRMVIKDAIMELLVNNTDRAVDEVTELAATQGGYIISARSWFDGDQKYANMRLGIPSANFERTLTFLRALGIKVINETASGQDVSAEYNDLETRLQNLEATAARVRTFLDQAENVEDSLRINQTLSELEGEINQVKGQMKFYEGRSAFSTIDITLNPLAPTPTITPTPSPTPTPTPWNPGATIQDASKRGIGLWQDIIDSLIWICFVTWPLILLGLIIWLVIWLIRRNRRSKTSPAPAKNEPPQAPPTAN